MSRHAVSMNESLIKRKSRTCGDSMHVPFRVEAADGDKVTDETEVVYTTREAEMDGGWLVQSQADGNGRCRTD